MSEPSLREKLLELESVESKLNERVRKPVEEMMYKKLNIPMRISFSVALLMGLAFAVGFTWVGLTAPAELPFILKMVFFEGAFFGLAWAAFAGWTLKKGKIHLLKSDDIIQGLTFAFIVLLMIHLMIGGDYIKDKVVAMSMVLNGMVFLILFGVPAMFHMRIRKTENMLTERLLKIELKLAEISDSMKK